MISGYKLLIMTLIEALIPTLTRVLQYVSKRRWFVVLYFDPKYLFATSLCLEQAEIRSGYTSYIYSARASFMIRVFIPTDV